MMVRDAGYENYGKLSYSDGIIIYNYDKEKLTEALKMSLIEEKASPALERSSEDYEGISIISPEDLLNLPLEVIEFIGKFCSNINWLRRENNLTPVRDFKVCLEEKAQKVGDILLQAGYGKYGEFRMNSSNKYLCYYYHWDKLKALVGKEKNEEEADIYLKTIEDYANGKIIKYKECNEDFYKYFKDKLEEKGLDSIVATEFNGKEMKTTIFIDDIHKTC